MKTYKFILDVNVLLDFLLKREDYKSISKIIDFLVKNKNGYISSSSLPIVHSVISEYRKEVLSALPKIFKQINIWKTPSYIDWNHPLVQCDMESYLIHLTAESLDAFVITKDEIFLKYSDRAISVEDFFRKILEEEEDMEVPFLNLPVQSGKIFPKVERKLDTIINKANFICGKYVKEFEEKFAEYLGAKFCIGVNSGTSALMVALMAIELKPGEEVIMPVNTFIATAEAVSILGGKPVFVDIHPTYYTIDVTQIEDKITERTKAIIPVHLYGQCADMDPIMEIAKKYSLWVIEDACQAHGAEYKGRKAGTIGHIGCFSFYPGKNLGAWGEAGAVVTHDNELAEKMYMIRNHGDIKKYEHKIIGGNFRMEEFQGAVLSTKLKYLSEWNEHRRLVAMWYKEDLESLERNGKLILPKEAPYNYHVYHLYVVRLLNVNRNRVVEELQRYNIYVGIHYPKPLHMLDCFLNINSIYSCPVAESVQKNIISLPIGEHISRDQVRFVCDKLEALL